MSHASLRAFLLALTVVGCGNAVPGGNAAHASIGGETVARVADIDLPVVLVREVAVARKVTPAVAVGLLIDDAVAAKYASSHGLDRTPEARVAITAVKARATIDRLKADMRKSPPTADEVRAATALHWVDVDVPETVVAVHAIAVRPKKPNHDEQATAEAAAKQVAAAIAAAEVGAVDASDFEARASAIPHPGVEVVVQPLDPFTADGRVAVAGSQSQYDPKFAAGAFALSGPGATSGVVESAFGWHIIRLIEKRRGKTLPFEERRQMFAQEIYLRRGNEALAALVHALAERERVTKANGLDEILAEALPAAQSHESPPAAPASP